LLIGEGVGIGPILARAEQLRDSKPLVLLGSDIPFPFRPRPSLIVVAGMPDGVIACMPLLEEWGVASRLASHADFPGCFDGSVVELADHWLKALSPQGLAQVGSVASGAAPMLEAAVELAHRHRVPINRS
jgi:dihydroorotate dehydrogenase electron transfer subunit